MEKKDICNMALDFVGSNSITSLNVNSVDDSNSKKAIRKCNRFFDQARDEILTRYRWRCALARAELAEDPTPPVGDEWDKRFQLPSTPLWCLRVLQMELPNMSFSVEKRFLLTNESQAIIKFISRVENYGELDAHAVWAIANSLGAKIAVSLQGDKGVAIKDNLLDELEKIIIPEAKKANALQANEPSVHKAFDTEWTAARQTGPWRGIRLGNPPTS